MAVEYITEVEAKAFATKLASFGEQLTAKEQALLREILLRAVQDEDDVEGHSAISDPAAIGQAPHLAHAALILLHGAHQHLHMIAQQVLASLQPSWPHLPPHPGR